MAESSFEVFLEFNQSRKPIIATCMDLLFKIEQHLDSLGKSLWMNLQQPFYSMECGLSLHPYYYPSLIFYLCFNYVVGDVVVKLMSDDEAKGGSIEVL